MVVAIRDRSSGVDGIRLIILLVRKGILQFVKEVLWLRKKRKVVQPIERSPGCEKSVLAVGSGVRSVSHLERRKPL